jgi:hypothetical protein
MEVIRGSFPSTSNACRVSGIVLVNPFFESATVKHRSGRRTSVHLRASSSPLRKAVSIARAIIGLMSRFLAASAALRRSASSVPFSLRSRWGFGPPNLIALRGLECRRMPHSSFATSNRLWSVENSRRSVLGETFKSRWSRYTAKCRTQLAYSIRTEFRSQERIQHDSLDIATLLPMAYVVTISADNLAKTRISLEPALHNKCHFGKGLPRPAGPRPFPRSCNRRFSLGPDDPLGESGHAIVSLEVATSP